MFIFVVKAIPLTLIISQNHDFILNMKHTLMTAFTSTPLDISSLMISTLPCPLARNNCIVHMEEQHLNRETQYIPFGINFATHPLKIVHRALEMTVWKPQIVLG